MTELSTIFTQMTGCTVPVQQAPIGFAAARPELAAAVAAAGGHGTLAAVAMPADVLEERLTALNARTRAYAVNLIQPLATDAAVDVAAALAPMVELYLGDPDPRLCDRARSHGALLSVQVSSVEEARAAEAAGADVVVARGGEAGGRTLHTTGMLVLLDAVLDAVDVPVLAAGGIATGRGVAAVLAAGAAGARVGTRFLVAEEADTHPVHAAGVLAAGLEDTVLTEAFSVGGPRTPHRVLRSALEAAEAFDGEVVAEMDAHGELVRVPRFHAHNPSVSARGMVEAMALYTGESAGLVTRRQPAGEIVEELARDAAELLGRLAPTRVG